MAGDVLNRVIRFTLDTSVQNIHIGTVKQYSSNTVTLQIQMVEKGKPYLIESGCRAVVSTLRPDRTYTMANGTFSPGQALVTYTLSINELEQVGVHSTEVLIFGVNKDLLVSSKFSYLVEKTNYDGAEITAQPQYPVLVTMIQDIRQALVDSAGVADNENERKAAELARKAEEVKRKNAESGRVSAESARVSAESQRNNFEAQRQQEEVYRLSSEDQRRANESIRVKAERKRVDAESVREGKENWRNAGEETRIAGENARKTAEAQRVALYNQVNTAEPLRAQAESERAAAETVRRQFEHKGSWNAEAAYKKNNVVTHAGSSYMALQENAGKPPASSPQWALIAMKGIDGTGSGNMNTAVYDTNTSGVVDDAERLGGELPSYYANAAASMPWVRQNPNSSEDPNTIDKPLIGIKHANGPDGVGWYWIISWKIVVSSAREDMMQIAIPYSGPNSLKRLFVRYRFNGTWNEWYDVAKRTVDEAISKMYFSGVHTVQATSWISFPTPDGYSWRTQVPLWDIRPNDFAHIAFVPESRNEAVRCGITRIDTKENHFHLFAKLKPQTALTFDYDIRRRG